MGSRTKKPVSRQVYMNESKTGRPTYSNWSFVDMRKEDVYCCGCGLMHRSQYRIKNGKLQERTKEVASATREMRKYMKKRKQGIFGGRLTSWD